MGKTHRELEDILKDNLTSDIKGEQRDTTLEEAFQKTLDITTPSEPGDLRHYKEPKSDTSYWI